MSKAEKTEKTEKIDPDAAYSMTAKQLFENRKNRDIITGSLSLDIGLGGGIPLGCTVLLGGRNKCGKTTISLTYAAQAQKKFGSKVFFANIEGRLDNKLLSQIQGLDLDGVEVIMGPAIQDKDGNIVGNRKMPAQKWWDKIGELITKESNSVIIVDSISALSEESELAQGMGFQSRGGLQKLEAQFARQYGDLVVPNRITLFLLAQLQCNTSGFGETTQMKCGNALKHLGDAIIFIKNIERWKPNSDGKILGHDINCRVENSPLGPPLLETKVGLRYGFGLDYPYDIFNNALNWDMIKAKGSWYILPFKESDNNIYEITKENEEGLVKIQGEENCRNWLIKNIENMNLLEKKIKEKIFI